MFTKLLLCAAYVASNDGVAKVQVKKVPSITVEQEIGDIGGYYTCKGVEVGGKTYNGVVVISRKGDVYVVQWAIGSGSTFTGVGIRQGNTFAASWALGNERGQIVKGVNVYQIENANGNPRLRGRWASMPGNAVLQSEALSFLKKLDEDN